MSDASSPSSSSSRQLRMARPGESVKSSHGLKSSTYKGVSSEQQFHIFTNHTDRELQLSWVWKGGEKKHGSIAPHSHSYVGTYSFHEWLIKESASGQLLGAYKGESATIEVKDNGCTIRINSTIDDPTYSCRGSVLGMEIWAFDAVSDKAILRVQHVVSKMLERSPSFVVERMTQRKALFGVVSRDQVITDSPPHRFMKAVYKDRDLDRTCRGLGGTLAVPCTALSEENLTMEDDRWYPGQSILVHELAHAVLNLALVAEAQQDLMECYERAKRGSIYPKESYLLTNEQEFFAVLSESWFESTLRNDLNGGVQSREDIKAKDPLAADLMLRAWGDGSWRFHQDCPVPLTIKKRKGEPQVDPDTSPAPVGSTMERQSSSQDHKTRRLTDKEGFRSSPPFAGTNDLCLASCFPTSLLGIGMGDIKEDKMR